MYCGKPEIFLRRKLLNRGIFTKKLRTGRLRLTSYDAQAANDYWLALDTNANNCTRDSERPMVQPPQPSVAMAKKARVLPSVSSVQPAVNSLSGREKRQSFRSADHRGAGPKTA